MLIYLFSVLSLLISAFFIYNNAFGIINFIALFIASFLAINVLYVIFLYAVSLFLPDDDSKKYDYAWARTIVRLTMQWILQWSRVSIEIAGLEKLPDENFVFVSNHLSKYDPISVYVVLKDRKIAFISKKENMKIPIAGRFIRMAGFLSLDRENPLRAMRTVRRAADMMVNNGFSIGIYPEGTRSQSGELLPFKTGAFVIAQKSKSPIVISVITGTNSIKSNAPWKKTKVCLNVISVISKERVSDMTPEEISDEVRNEMLKFLPENKEDAVLTNA